jgi:PAS domain S-box-containing protein
MSINKIKNLTETLVRVEDNLKEEKEVLEFILEHTTDGYWDWDLTSNYQYLSPKLKKQLGYEEDEMENKPESWQVICDKLDLEKTEKRIEDHLDGITEDFKSLIHFTHKDGHIVKILCRGKVVKRDENNQPLRMIGTHTIIL